MRSETLNIANDKTPGSNVVCLSAATMKDDLIPNSEKPSAFHDMGMPPDYIADSDGIYFLEPDEFGDVSPVRICSPMTVVGRCRRENGTGWGLLVEVLDPDGRTHKVILEETSLHGTPAALMRPLVDLGLQIEKTGTALKRVAHLLGAWKPQHSLVRSTRTGWLDSDFDAFILADGSLIGQKRAILERDAGAIGTSALTNGDLEIWRNEVALACVGNPLMILALSQAFVGPLLSLLNLDGGGFHLRGASSRGKTTLLGIAASVWGSPKFVQSWRATDNALEGVASCCNDSLLALDELHQVSPKVAGDIIYMLANGRGKGRMVSAGKSTPSETWHVALLSSGEISLEDHLASGGKTIHAGQEIRLIDIESDGRNFGAFDNLHSEIDARPFVEKLQQATASHYGHAGRAYVERLIANANRREDFKKIMNRFVDQHVKKHDLDKNGQILRVLKRFAVAALAGELATSFGLTGWSKGDAFKGVGTVADTWIENREAIRTKDICEALEKTRAHLSAHSDRFALPGPSSEVDGWIDDAWFYIRPEVWARIHDGENSQAAARLHKVANMLKTDRGDTLQLKMGRAILGRPKVYAVSRRILDA